MGRFFFYLNRQILLILTILLGYYFYQIKSLRICVIGASSGVGQQICSKFRQEKYSVTAIGRSLNKLERFPLLDGCDKVEVLTSNIEKMGRILDGASAVVICVGTSAFPSKSWEGGANNPRVACYDSVANVFSAIKRLRSKPSKVVLVSSIGVDRTNLFPFKILNLYGVLNEKKRSETLLLENCQDLRLLPIICRPGRLIGEPFTNFDLAKLLKIEQKKDKLGILIEKSAKDVLVGDVARKDVAESIFHVIRADSKTLLNSFGPSVIYSIVNSKGKAPQTDKDWIQTLFTKQS